MLFLDVTTSSLISYCMFCLAQVDLRKLHCYWGEPERAPHYRGLRDHVHWPTDRPTNWPTVSVPFTWYWYVAHAHATTRCRHAMLMWTVQCVVVIAKRLRTPMMGKRKAETPTQRTVRLERERDQRTFHTCVSLSVSPWILGFTYVTFSRRSLHTNPFSHFPTYEQHVHTAFWTRLHAHVMHTGMHRPHPLA